MKSKKEKRKDKEIYKDSYNKCRNYHGNLSRVEANRLKYDEIANDMYGAGSVVMKDVIMENAGDPSHVWDHYLVKKKDEFLLERAALPHDTAIVNKMLNNIADGEVVDMITECYIDRNKKHDNIAYNRNRSKSAMYPDMSRAVLNQLKK